MGRPESAVEEDLRAHTGGSPRAPGRTRLDRPDPRLVPAARRKGGASENAERFRTSSAREPNRGTGRYGPTLASRTQEVPIGGAHVMGLGRAGAYHWSVARAGISLIRREAHPSRAYVTAGLELKMAQK